MGSQNHHQSTECAALRKDLPQGDLGLKVLQLTKALRGLLEAQDSHEEQDFLRRQVSGDTVQKILEWLSRDQVGSVSQHRHTNPDLIHQAQLFSFSCWMGSKCTEAFES